MITWLKELDDVLRGHKADPKLLAEGTAHIRIASLVGVSIVLGVLYGVCMGLYAVVGRTVPSYEQVGASALKVPAQIVVRRYYGPLIRRSERHRRLLWAWFGLYAFVGIQMGWVLRPFIGDPEQPVAFFRTGAWGNAYVVVAGLVAGVFRRRGPNPAGSALWIMAAVLIILAVTGFCLVIRPQEKRAARGQEGHGDSRKGGRA